MKVTKEDMGVLPFAELTTAAREIEPAVGVVQNAAAKKLQMPMAARTATEGGWVGQRA